MLNQSLQQKLAQKLSPQQIKLMKLIQLPTIELEEKVKEELEENPAIEEVTDRNEASELESYDLNEEKSREAEEINIDEYLSDDETPRYRLVANNASPDQEQKSIPVSMGVSSIEILENQLALRNLDDHQYQIGLFLIGCVNDSRKFSSNISIIINTTN